MSLHPAVEKLISASNVIVFENGEVVHKELDEDIYFDTLKNARTLNVVEKNEGLILKRNEKILNYNSTNENGYVLYFKDNLRTDIQVIHTYNGNGTTNERLFVCAAKFAEVNYFENKVSIDVSNHEVVNDTEILILDSANVTYTTFNDLTSGVNHKYNRVSEVRKDASLNFAQSELSDSNNVEYLITDLVESGSNSDSNLICVGTKKQENKFVVRTNNLAPHTVGNITNHGVVLDTSTIIFDGIGFIEKGMNSANAQQESRLLVFGEGGKAVANPELLIDEYDVMAGHAASIGKIDEENLYYLMSRGVDRETAEKLIVYGFLTPVVAHLEDEKLIQQFEANLNRKLA